MYLSVWYEGQAWAERETNYIWYCISYFCIGNSLLFSKHIAYKVGIMNCLNHKQTTEAYGTADD